MKKTLLVSALVICFLLNINFVSAKEKTKSLDGFLGIKWGETQNTVDTVMLNRTNTTKDESSTKEYSLYNCTFIGLGANIYCNFYKKSFFQAVVLINDISRSKIIDKWRDIKRQISKKYGPPASDLYSFESPYYEGDGYEESAIELEKCTAEAEWDFPSPEGKNDDFIRCEITKDLKIKISYANGQLTKQYFKAKARKDAKDL